MNFLRSLIFTLLLIVATVIWTPVVILASVLPYNLHYRLTACWNWFVVGCAKYICGINYVVKGAENYPDGPAIVLSKHQSAWETIFLLAASPRPLVFVFKKEIQYIPFFGWAITMLRMIPIDRSKGKDAFAQVLQHGKKRLADGQWIIMFPEGTRIPVGQKGNYKGGGARLAVETQTPVVPIALNSGECWPKNSFSKRPGTITVSVGKPISSEGKTGFELMAEVEAWIEGEMRVISPQAYNSTSASDKQQEAA